MDARARTQPLAFLRHLAWAFYYLVLPGLAFPSLLLLLRAATWRGHLGGLAAVALVSLPLVWRLRRNRRWPVAAAVAPVILAVIALPLAAPSGVPPAGSGVVSTWPQAEGYRRYSLWNLVPEIDQAAAGISAAAVFDDRIWRATGRIRGLVLPAYRELEADPAFASLGSTMNYAYADVLGGTFDVGHFYAYVPQHAAGERLPTILFLHGSVGNFQVYLWAWKRFADRNRFVVVCPSFGFGLWDRRGGAEAALRALDRAEADLPIDPSRVWLAGLSNGGLGVTRAGARAPERFRGLVYLSGVVEDDWMTSPEFVEAWRGRPVLIVHGDRDDRVPMEYVSALVPRMEALGVTVTLRLHAGEDHFLFLSSLDAVLADLEAWVK